MNAIARYATQYSQRSRAKRAQTFRRLFPISGDAKVLDLGSDDGQHIADLLSGSPIEPANVFIADIDPQAVAEGARRFGFTPVVIEESGRLPFPDQYFDVVHCSSVIEHVTVPKAEIWSLRSGREFRRRSLEAQARFADEIKRVGAQYYVQTPDRWFLVESHSWLPLLGWIPRRVLVPLLRLTNKFWVKKTSPDWHLLDSRQLSQLFDGRPVLKEKSFGMVKSVTAAKSAGTSGND